MPQENISSQIDLILERRKEKAAKLRARRDALKELNKAIADFNKLPNEADNIQDAALQEKYRELFQKAALPDALVTSIKRTNRKLDATIVRFERPSLNIATVGKARQGKSTFLQAVSGLDNMVIPAYASGDCTGAVSVIHNVPSMTPGTIRAELSFRSKEELLSVVKGYVDLIDANYWNTHPVGYDEIPEMDLASLKKRIQKGESKKTTYLGHLSRIVDDFNGMGDSCSTPISELIGQSTKVLTDPNEIRQYVAQNNGEDPDSPERENYYSYLAVKRAEIYCNFPDHVGKLQLIDTIGVEDIQVGITDAMLETVDKDCDATIVVTKPDAGAHENDFDLYELLFNKFKSREMNKWVFYLANEHVGYNEKAVGSFVNNVQNGNFDVAWCKKINLYDQESVRHDFLLPMLDTLFANIEEIDSMYIKEIDDMCAELYKKVKGALANLPKPEVMDPGSGVNLEVYNLGVQCYKNMAKSLAKQMDHWYQNRNKPNATLWNRVKDILNNLEEILPSAEVLQQVLDDAGDAMGFQLWQIPLNYVRNEITDQFIGIDDLMEEENRAFKNNLVRDLYHSLKNLSGEVHDEETGEDTDMAAWLWEVMEPMLRDNLEYKQIYNGLQFLSQFEFNVRAQMIREVRNQLRIINPMTVEYYMQPNYVFHKGNAGEAVYFYLTSRLAILEDGLRYSLAQMNKMPNQAFYAAAEEFYDRMTFASDFKNGTFVDMSQIWGQFFTQYSRLLWAKQVDRHKAAEEIIKKYEQLSDMLNTKLAALA